MHRNSVTGSWRVAWGAVGLVVLVCAALAVNAIAAAPKKEKAAEKAEKAADNADEAINLSHEVWALQAIHDFDLNAEQLKALKAMAVGTVTPPGQRDKPKVTEKYLNALRSLRDGLVKGEDDDEIDSLRDDVETMQEDDEELDVDDSVTVNDAARAKVPEVLKLVTPSQVASYVAAYQDEAPEPVQTLMDAADDVRGSDDEDFKATTDDTADDIGVLVAGLEPEKQKPVRERVRTWLAAARKMSEADMKAKHDELEKQAKAIVGDVDPFLVLRHWVERDVSELLANPQLPSAVDERLKALATAGTN